MNSSLTSASIGKSLQKETQHLVANREDVLEVYHLPYDPDYLAVCIANN
jgi:hypothetical protein